MLGETEGIGEYPQEPGGENPAPLGTSPAPGWEIPARLRAVALIVAAGLAIRLLVMAAIWANGGSPLIGDEGNYVLSALPLSEGRGIPDLWLWIRAPGFIGFAAGVFALTGGSLFALNLVQIALSGITMVIAYALGTFTTEDPAIARRSGLIATALVAFNPLLILSDNFFLSEPLYILLVMGLVLALVIYARSVRSGDARAWRWLAVAGLIGGLGLLTRPNLQFYLPLVAIWLFWLHRRTPLGALGRVALLALVALAVVLPWSARNLERFGHFIFIDTVGSYVLYLDNTNLSPAEVNADLQRIPNQGERQSYAFEQGFKWIAAHKGHFLTRTLARMTTSWSADPFLDLRYPVRDKLPGTSPWGRDLYALAASVAYLLLTALAIGGLIAAPRGDLKWLVLLFLAAYVLTIGLSNNEFRYRLPVLALTAPFAGYALAAPGTFWPLKREKWRPGAVAATLLALLFVLVSLPLVLPGLADAVQARTHKTDQRDPAQRAQALEEVAKMDVVYSQPWRQAAASWVEAGRADKAIEDYKTALEREPGDWRARVRLSELYRDAGNQGKAAQVTNSVPPTFNATMQSWAWAHAAPPPAQVDVGSVDVGWVKGFYVGEGSNSVTYRWSTGDAWIMVGLPKPNAKRLIIHARGLPTPDGQPLTVRWKVNGQDEGTRLLDGGWQDYTFDIPQPSARDRVEVELYAQARRPSPEDPRELAVAVDTVRVEP
ncbi:MAG: glycosyltransferase family 39 protein [Chloroflexia bacterium]